jgi:hypothetical protein
LVLGCPRGGFLGTTAPLAAAAQAKSRVAVVYGDSLMWETKADLVKHMRADRIWKVEVRAFPATAPCDWRAQTQADLASLHPDVVAIESVGASYVDGSPAWAAK